MKSSFRNPRSETIKVFIADDHAIVREGLRLLLESQADISVVGETGNGRDAVNQIQHICPDVAIMDIVMPEMNGIEVTELIHKTCPSTKVVVLSMHATSEHIFRALKAGAKGYLLKESAGKEVIKAVRSVNSGRRYLCQQISETLIEDYISEHDLARDKSPLDHLSAREREVLQMVAEGKSSIEIAKLLQLSPKTVETYRSRLMQKIGVSDIPGLVKFAIQHGITPLK
jgi:DNA-binding NarL/FixJ family response regulator